MLISASQQPPRSIIPRYRYRSCRTPAGSSSLPWNERPKSLFKIELRNSPIAGGTHVVGARLPGLSGTNRLIVRYVIIEAVPVGRLSVRVGRRRGSRGRSGGRCKRHDLSKKIVDAEWCGERGWSLERRAGFFKARFLSEWFLLAVSSADTA